MARSDPLGSGMVEQIGIKPVRVGPLAGFIPLFDPPEVLDNAQNAAGLTPDEAGDEVATNGQVGNLQLSPRGRGRPRQLPEDPDGRLFRAEHACPVRVTVRIRTGCFIHRRPAA
jgi:hypothetical protein